MQFGVQFFPAVDHTDKSAAEYYAQSLAIAEEAEELGFQHVRTVEHYFTRYGGYSPNPIVFLAAASQRTKTMRLVTGAVLPVFNHPFKLAGEIAMLDGISGGRLDVGLARAFLPHEFRRFGISVDESQARFREGLEQIELLLTQENATHRGRFHSFEDVTSLPRPTERPPFEEYFRALNEAVGDWTRGTTSKDYRDYDKSMRRLRSFTLNGQIESGGAWVGTPAEIKAIIARVIASIGYFEHASLQINFSALDFRAARRSMRLFAAEVIPHFADNAPDAMARAR